MLKLGSLAHNALSPVTIMPAMSGVKSKRTRTARKSTHTTQAKVMIEAHKRSDKQGKKSRREQLQET
jgi:hypothetical protein